MKRDIALASGNTLKTLAVLRVAPQTARFAARTLARIASGGVSCAGIIVAGEGDIDRDALTAAGGDIPVSFSGDANGFDAARNGVRDGGASGVFLIAAGMHLPDAFDVRLARIAMQDPLVGTVSPLIAEGLAAEEIDRLDRLAFLLGRKTYFEIPASLPECRFVSAGAIERGLSREGLVHVLSDSVYVGKLLSAEIALRLEPQRGESPQLAQTRKAILDAFEAGAIFRAAPGLDSRPVHLHVMHSLGGGSETWLKDFGLADASRTNLVLKSVTHGPEMASGLALYTHVLDEAPLKVWHFSTPIQATVEAHLEYRGVLNEIIAEHCVDALVVSSLIGHSLDALDTGLPTVVVTHDYFPYCPAINIHFGGVCRTCDAERIGECHRENHRFNPFITFMPRERVAVREKYMRLIRRPEVRLVTPSRSVIENLTLLNPLFAEVQSTTIPHGYGQSLQARPHPDLPAEGRMRILVLGQLSVLKGVELLQGALREITKFADVHLVGSRELGEVFQYEPGVHVVSRYQIEDLPIHVANINPHVGLLMSIAPETFSYALTELQMLGVPVAATRVGSFPERIRHGETGYLYEPDQASLVAMLRAVDADRKTLARVRANLRGFTPRGAGEMVADYHRLVPVEDLPYARYPLHRPSTAAGSARDQVAVSQSVTLASMWKDVKSLNLSLGVVNEARRREQRNFAALTQHVQQVEERARAIEERARKSEDDYARRIAERNTQLESLLGRLDFKSAQLAEVYDSTSWRLSRPVRWVGGILRDMKTLARCLAPGLRNPRLIPRQLLKLGRALRTGGWTEFKKALLGLQARQGAADSWQRYRREFREEVRPRIVARIAEMQPLPRISIILPTYNTPETLLRETLDSVRFQLYPEWELCVADDGSSAPHVARVLKEYAARDPRIKLHLGETNKGVSHASNRALDLATGEFVVLLDHDDVLEEQALFRVAESVVEDRPDMVYSDEVLVTADKSEVMRYAYRPAFSPELLRSHPYIVHLVGFRTRLARDVGGFDESLRISQDYDFILRVCESAQTIVHIPEILYQWRQLDDSAGAQKKDQVMETSSALLQRHLDRCGEKALAGPGASFNLFDVRYPLAEGSRVAVIIPTKNHGDLLRQCIESLRATIKEAVYDIIVVDHESDDPDTLAYLTSIASSVRVIRYEGVFNFSAINNYAVAQLGDVYSHYLLCNNDIEAIGPGWLERMLELGQQRSVGVVGAKLLYPDRKTIQHAGVCVGAYGAAEHYGKRLRYPGDFIEPGFAELLVLNHEVAAVTAACLLIRADVFAEICGFDEAIAVGFGDVDLCLRAASKGYRILFCPHAELVHHESYTRGTSTEDPHPADSALFKFKWRALLEAGDPYYSPGLSLVSTNWSLKQPLYCSYAIGRRVATRDPGPGAHLSFTLLRS